MGARIYQIFEGRARIQGERLYCVWVGGYVVLHFQIIIFILIRVRGETPQGVFHMFLTSLVLNISPYIYIYSVLAHII
jgi:hypothetical protein